MCTPPPTSSLRTVKKSSREWISMLEGMAWELRQHLGTEEEAKDCENPHMVRQRNRSCVTLIAVVIGVGAEPRRVWVLACTTLVARRVQVLNGLVVLDILNSTIVRWHCAERVRELVSLSISDATNNQAKQYCKQEFD
jgi:hypothetical protein